MISLLQHIFELLTTATGTLAYHLVLAFTILGALQVSFSHWMGKQSSSVGFLRLLWGLGCLLALQFILFIFSGLAWQGVLDGDFWLPPIDRAVILFSLVWIIWMWIFPRADLIADLLTLILVVLLLIGAVFAFFWWGTQYPNLAYNISWADFLAQIAAMALLLLGAIILVIRRTAGWPVGLVMFALFALGHVLHLMLPLTGEQYSGAVRATQLAAFPFLFILAQRRYGKPPVEIASPPPDEGTLVEEKPDQEWDRDAVAMLSRIFAHSDEMEVYQQTAIELAKFAGAGVCCYLTALGEGPLLSLKVGYDALADRSIASISLDGTQLPQVTRAYRAGQPAILQPDEQGSDLITLARLCKFEAREDAFLFVPGLDSQGRTLGAVLMALPATGAMWGQEEQLRLHKIMNLIVQHIARNQSISMLNEQAAKIRQSDAVRRSQLMRPDPEPSMSNELRLALEEISILRASLAEWEAKAASAGLPSPETPPDFSHLDHIVHIAQDMQQPLASLQDYTEILLGEQFGVLGEKQQKNLERIRMSSERISRLANELVQVVLVEKQLSKLSIKELDLGALIVQVKERLSVALDEKQIAIKIDQSQQGFSVYSDMQALSMILEQVLHYCISLTPVRGQITLAARLEHKDGSPDYALIQWMSSVDASTWVDLSQVFSQKRGAKPEAREDAATGVNLFKVRSLVEALGGRIWVDVEQGKSTIFSMVLPVIQGAQGKQTRMQHAHV